MTKYFKKHPKAFSLVEVVIAMGIVSCSCLVLLGLMGNGLITVNRAVGTTVQAGIIQTVIDDVDSQPYPTAFTTTYFPTNMYFSDQGSQVAQTDPTQVYTATLNAVQLTNASAANYLYNTNNACLLQVWVSSKSLPSVTNFFSLVWPNSGN